MKRLEIMQLTYVTLVAVVSRTQDYGTASKLRDSLMYTFEALHSDEKGELTEKAPAWVEGFPEGCLTAHAVEVWQEVARL